MSIEVADAGVVSHRPVGGTGTAHDGGPASHDAGDGKKASDRPSRRRGFASRYDGQTPPTCTAVACRNPVRPAYGYQQDYKRGKRIVNGLRWRWFCSRACTARHVNASGRGVVGVEVLKALRQKMMRSRVSRAKDVLAQHVGEDGRLSLVEAVRYAVQEGRREYLRGYTACYNRARRGTLEMPGRVA